MEVVTEQIQSSKDGGLPWYETSVSDGVFQIDADRSGNERDLSGQSVTIDTSKDSLIAVTQQSELISSPSDSDNPPLYSVLARYDRKTDSVTVLEFVES